ncbi:MAG: undecaprenyl-phosphate galactose phosphotransferase WbaP [Prochlorotrichaceae cyanobacterium]|jgi:Undecaprenyl-phosphate galactose phosphotransferase WbaP
MKTLPIHRAMKPAVAVLERSARPWPTLCLMVMTDFVSLAGAISLSIWGRLWLGGTLNPEFYMRLWPLLFLFLLVYALQGLYPGVTIGPVDELRSISISTSLVYLFLGAVIFLFREGVLYSRGSFIAAWLFSIIFVLLGRMFLRHTFARRSWWGFPTIVLGAGKTGELVVRTLQKNAHLGLKPVVILDDDGQKRGELHGVPILGDLSLAPMLARRLNLSYAIVAMPGVESVQLLTLLEQYGQTFPHLLIIPDLFGMASLWVEAKDLAGVLGLEIRQQLLLPGPRFTKLVVDLTIATVLSILLLPFITAIALLIRLDSPGPIFYGHTRLGRGGQTFKAWKFRTMVKNADGVLEHYLQDHPNAREQWETNRKLKADPRITRMGKILRRTSLDELPQLWNVLRRQMSLVGPRPIVDAEVVHYAEKFRLYTRVLPGITGLWQVSGRSNTTYDDRVAFDAYYVRNWSVWLDIYILVKTVWVVLRGDGAY